MRRSASQLTATGRKLDVGPRLAKTILQKTTILHGQFVALNMIKQWKTRSSPWMIRGSQYFEAVVVYQRLTAHVASMGDDTSTKAHNSRCLTRKSTRKSYGEEYHQESGNANSAALVSSRCTKSLHRLIYQLPRTADVEPMTISHHRESEVFPTTYLDRAPMQFRSKSDLRIQRLSYKTLLTHSQNSSTNCTTFLQFISSIHIQFDIVAQRSHLHFHLCYSLYRHCVPIVS